MASSDLAFRTFDPSDELFIVERRNLPHWLQAGTVAFITWRIYDSLPKSILAACRRQRSQWLVKHNIDPNSDRWRDDVARLTARDQFEFRRIVAERWEESLDAGHGECVLRRPELSQIVADSLLRFDGERYNMTDFVVMPNHVHLLAAFPTAEFLLRQCDSWKHFTASQINRQLARKGRFWEFDAFDHLVRSEEQFFYFRNYIANNPVAVGLMPGEFRHYSKLLPELTEP